MKQELLDLIDGNDVISFDIFDTLVFRNIYKPTDIFRILEKEALSKYKIKNFFQTRIDAERESRTEENNYECCYDEIYDCIKEKINNGKAAKFLKEEELKLEKKFLVVNPFMKDIYDYCISKGKKILIISDMYLNEDFILDLLKRFGYEKFTLYLSNVYKKTKGNSSLFELVYSKEKIKKSKWLHIGDNLQSDFNSPKSVGINAFHYKNVNSLTNIKSYSVFESIILGIQNNYLYNGNEIDYWDKFGVLNVSTIYFGFTKWLYDLTKNYDNLFFIARDGYIIEKIYKLFDKNINTNYLYCSRNSLVIPSLYNLDTEELVNNLIKMYHPNVLYTLEKFLKECRLNKEDVESDLITAFNFKTFDDVISESNIYNLKKLLVVLAPKIKEKLEKDFNIVRNYLIQEKVDNYSHINIMDIGWAGSIQSSIKRILNKDVNGYYFGTIDENQKDGFTTMFGYYFDFDHLEENKKNILDNVMMYELIFSAPHGTTKGYEKKKGIISPILDSNKEYNKVVETFQNSAISIIKRYLEYIDYFDFLSKEFCTYSYRKFIKEKNYEDIIEFSHLSNDFILNNDSKFSYVNEISLDDVADEIKFMQKSSSSLWPYTFILKDKKFDKKKYLYYRNVLYTCINKIEPLKYMKVYLDYGNGFNEMDMLFVPIKNDNGRFSFKLNLNHYENVKNIKIRIVDNKKVIIRNLIIYSNLGGSVVEIPHKNYILGKLRRCICIDSKTPEIIVKNTTDNKYIYFFANVEVIN